MCRESHPRPRSFITLSELPYLACAAWTTCCFGRGDSAAAVGVTGQNFIYETPPTLSLEYIARRAHSHSPPLYSPPSTPARLLRRQAFLLRLYIAIIRGTLTYIQHTPGNRLLFSANKLKQHRYTRRTSCFILLLDRSSSNATTPTAQHPHSYIYAPPSLP